MNKYLSFPSVPLVFHSSTGTYWKAKASRVTAHTLMAPVNAAGHQTSSEFQAVTTICPLPEPTKVPSFQPLTWRIRSGKL